MKLLFISLVILFVTIGSANACEQFAQKCVGEGESCPPSNIDPFTSCDYNTFCWFGENPKPGEYGNCTAWAKEGDFCDGDYWRCAPGLNCYFASESARSCQYFGYASIGESCESTFSCTNNNDCINGKCQLAATQEGRCSERWDDCPFGFSCNTTSEKCIETLTEGQICNQDQGDCSVGLICSPTSNTRMEYKCVAINSKGAGQACSDSYNGVFFENSLPRIDCDLSQNLLCLEDNNGDFTCQIPAPLTSGNCSNTGCDFGSQTCSCPFDSYTGSCVQRNNLGSDCSDSVNDLVQCAIDNECQAMSAAYGPKSCLYQHCSSYMCDNKCSFTDSDDSCYTKPYACYNYSPSSFLRPTIIIVAILALIAILF